MDRSSSLNRALPALIAFLAVVLVLILGIVVGAALVDRGPLRARFLHYVAARAGRPILIAGRLETHLLSLRPRMTAEQVTIGNPYWMPPGTMAQIGRLSLTLELPIFSRGVVIQRLELQQAKLHLVRDSTGRTNWHWREPVKPDSHGLPLIRMLGLPPTRVDLDDAMRHLHFEGTIAARAPTASSGSQRLEIQGSGQLNGKSVSLLITGDPLANATPRGPYHFTFLESSSGSRLSGHGELLRPFDLRHLDASFEGEGKDLKDLYFLIGLSLPDSAGYRLSGTLERRGLRFSYRDLLVKTGGTDLRGTLSTELVGERRRIDADLHSESLRVQDLGLRAAGRLTEPPGPNEPLLPDRIWRLAVLGRDDGTIRYRARTVALGRQTLQELTVRGTLDHGVLAVKSLAATLDAGKLSGGMQLDVTHDVPALDVDLRINGLQLGDLTLKSGKPSPLDGPLQGRILLATHGSSMHQLAANASGTLTVVVPHGAMRASVAELAGLDLARGLGLMLDKDHAETALRCGIASFQAQQGTLTVRSLVIDTDPVLITGSGTLSLASEAWDLNLHGKPKKPRLLRVRAPLEIRGSLRHPTVRIEGHAALAQAGAAAALGAVLTPLAAVLAFVDPGLAHDVNCSALLGQAKAEGVKTPSD
ncbi:MAG TPA: AsmA family protein [Steroidobacteraceae bacterium]|nr:AsmA family protein [Steroidobacteraceae bacterium]